MSHETISNSSLVTESSSSSSTPPPPPPPPLACGDTTTTTKQQQHEQQQQQQDIDSTSTTTNIAETVVVLVVDEAEKSNGTKSGQEGEQVTTPSASPSTSTSTTIDKPTLTTSTTTTMIVDEPETKMIIESTSATSTTSTSTSTSTTSTMTTTMIVEEEEEEPTSTSTTSTTTTTNDNSNNNNNISNNNNNNNINNNNNNNSNNIQTPLQGSSHKRDREIENDNNGFSFIFHVGPKVKPDKTQKKQKRDSLLSLSTTVLATPTPATNKKNPAYNLLASRQAHQPRTQSLSSKRQNQVTDANVGAMADQLGEIGGTDFFISLFSGSTNCSKLLKDCFRVSSTNVPTTPFGSMDNISIGKSYDSLHLDNDYYDQDGFHLQNGGGVGGGSDDEFEDKPLTTSTTSTTTNNHYGLQRFESIIAEEDESSSDEEKSYIKSLKERKNLEESEKGFNRVIREKIEQAHVNRLFFEPNRKRVPVKDQQLQDFLEQNIFTQTPIPRGFNEGDCTDGPYDTLFYTIHPLRLMGESVDGLMKKNAEDVIKDGVPTPTYKEVQPYVPYNINISRRFQTAYNQGYIVYNGTNNTLASSLSSMTPAKQQSPPLPNVKGGSVISSPPSTPLTLSSSNNNNVNSALSLVHQSSYPWKRVSEMFNTITWLPEETAMLCELYFIYGSDWSEISRILSGSKSPLQIYQAITKQKDLMSMKPHTTLAQDLEEIKKQCVICFLSTSGGNKKFYHQKTKKNQNTTLVTCFACERSFHQDCITDQPNSNNNNSEWYCSIDCSMTCQVRCNVCQKGDHEDSFVLCDKCSDGYHIYCLSPQLSEVPYDPWECSNCCENNNTSKSIGKIVESPSPLTAAVEDTLSPMNLEDVPKLERVSKDASPNGTTTESVAAEGNHSLINSPRSKEETNGHNDSSSSTTTATVVVVVDTLNQSNTTTPIMEPTTMMVVTSTATTTSTCQAMAPIPTTPSLSEASTPAMIKTPLALGLKKSTANAPMSPAAPPALSLGLQVYQHPKLHFQHIKGCQNASDSSSADNNTTAHKDNGGEEYSSSFARVLGKEGTRLASSATSKPFHTLKAISSVCLACLTSVSIFDDSDYSLGNTEITNYKDMISSEDIGEDDYELEAVMAKKFDFILAAIPIAVQKMIDEPLLMGSELQQQQQHQQQESNNSLLSAFVAASSSSSPQTTNENDTIVSLAGSKRKRKQKLQDLQDLPDVQVKIQLDDQITPPTITNTSHDEQIDTTMDNNNNSALKESQEFSTQSAIDILSTHMETESPIQPLQPLQLNSSGTLEGSKILLQMANGDHEQNGLESPSTPPPITTSTTTMTHTTPPPTIPTSPLIPSSILNADNIIQKTTGLAQSTIVAPPPSLPLSITPPMVPAIPQLVTASEVPVGVAPTYDYGASAIALQQQMLARQQYSMMVEGGVIPPTDPTATNLVNLPTYIQQPQLLSSLNNTPIANSTIITTTMTTPSKPTKRNTRKAKIPATEKPPQPTSPATFTTSTRTIVQANPPSEDTSPPTSSRKKKRSTISETIGIARGRRSRLTDGMAGSARWWIFSGNPKNRPELNAMQEGKQLEWGVRQHADNIRKNDLIYVWLCGKYAGISATAIALEDPVRVDAPSGDAVFVPSSKPNLIHNVQIQITKILPNILPKKTMAENKLLSRMTIIRAPLATNFWVTDEESEMLSTMVSQLEKGELDTLIVPNPSASSFNNNNNNNNGDDSNDDDSISTTSTTSTTTTTTSSSSTSIVSYSSTKRGGKHQQNDQDDADDEDDSDDDDDDMAIVTPSKPRSKASAKSKPKAARGKKAAAKPMHKCTMCDEQQTVSKHFFSCDSCGRYYHNHCLSDPVDKSLYSYWICYLCCMTEQQIINCKLVIGWLELRSKCRKILHDMCESFYISHKKNIYSGNKKKALNKMTQATCQLNTIRVLLSKVVNQRFSIWYQHLLQQQQQQQQQGNNQTNQ